MQATTQTNETMYEVKGQRFASSLTNDEAAAVLDELGGEFPKSLANQWQRRGQWSPKQEAWAHKLANDAMQPTPPAERVDDVAEGSELVEMFHRASDKLKFPSITLSTGFGEATPEDDQGQVIRFQLVTRGPNAGAININNGYKRHDPQNIWYGRIERDGSWTLAADVPAASERLIRAMCTDPKATARQYGWASGYCCFCNSRLTDERSTTMGYGPTCSKNYGMPWGKKAMEIAKAERDAATVWTTPEGEDRR